MNLLKRAKDAVANLFAPKPEPKPETERAVEPLTVAKVRKALKYAFISTRDYIVNGRVKRQTAVFNAGRNKERGAAGRSKLRIERAASATGQWGARTLKLSALCVPPERRAMLDARRVRQLAA